MKKKLYLKLKCENDFDPYNDMEYQMTRVCYFTKLWVCNIETIFIATQFLR